MKSNIKELGDKLSLNVHLVSLYLMHLLYMYLYKVWKCFRSLLCTYAFLLKPWRALLQWIKDHKILRFRI